MNKLNPCPFCGAMAEHISVCRFGRMYYVYCSNCEAETDIYATRNEARAKQEKKAKKVE